MQSILMSKGGSKVPKAVSDFSPTAGFRCGLLFKTFRFLTSKGLPREKGKEAYLFPLGIVTEAIISSVTLSDEINSHVDWLEILRSGA